MSVIDVESYSLVCDHCGEDVNAGTDYSGWADAETNRDIATDNGWLLNEQGDWCPDCCTWNEDESERIHLAALRTKEGR